MFSVVALVPMMWVISAPVSKKWKALSLALIGTSYTWKGVFGTLKYSSVAFVYTFIFEVGIFVLYFLWIEKLSEKTKHHYLFLSIAFFGLELAQNATLWGTNWMPLSLPWIDSPLKGTLRVIGSTGTSALLFLTNGAVFHLIKKKDPRPITVITVLLISLHFLGLADASASHSSGAISVAVTQPGKMNFFNVSPERQREYLADLLNLGTEHNADVLVCPEEVINYLILESPTFMKDVLNFAIEKSEWIVLGSWVRKDGEQNSVPKTGTNRTTLSLSSSALNLPQSPGNYTDIYNAVIVFSPECKWWYYGKNRLMVGGEAMPLEPLANLLEIRSMGFNFTSSRSFNVLPLRGVKLGACVCYESCFPFVCRKLSEKGAEILCVVTNTGGFKGSAIPFFHLYHARVRALETGKPFIHSSMIGPSAVIDHSGRIVDFAAVDERKLLFAKLRTFSEQTPYVAFGDFLAFFLISLGLGVLLCESSKNSG